MVLFSVQVLSIQMNLHFHKLKPLVDILDIRAFLLLAQYKANGLSLMVLTFVVFLLL